MERQKLIGLFIVSLVTLMTELLLMRVLDVILQPNMAYMVISMALFSFGLSGIYLTLKPLPLNRDINRYLSTIALLFSFFLLILRPIFNFLPFDYMKILEEPIVQILSFFGMYMAIALPFFFSGLIFTTIFSAYDKNIKRIYFWDLAGAAVGCVLLIPLLPMIGPGGELIIGAALVILSSGLFSSSKKWLSIAAAAAVLVAIIPFAKMPKYIDFIPHLEKRGVKQATIEGKIELTQWDPISKIDIIPNESHGKKTKHIAYDGGQQSSHFYPFDGDFKRLRDGIENGSEKVDDNFWFQGAIISHKLTEEKQGKDVLIIGSAGGQETKAALLYGAEHVDAIELVEAVVSLASNEYDDYIGNIFTNSKVRLKAGEGRSFLRETKNKYDIIQIFSNHTSSSIANGYGAISPKYLQTVEAYQEYFEHLKEDGILHINHHIYPRMVTTAALAWKKMGKNNFRRHVFVSHREKDRDTLPTLMIKMTPWSPEDIKKIEPILKLSEDGHKGYIVEDPIHPEKSFLSDAFYSGEFPSAIASKMSFRSGPITDNQPYFSFIRKKFGKFEEDPDIYLDKHMAAILTSMTKKGIPFDIIHLIITGIAALLMAFVFVVVPLAFSSAGKDKWPKRKQSLVYFSCLGAGFIIIELIFIQVFEKLIGYPLYTYSVVIFTLLLSAGIGSFMSSKLGIGVENRSNLTFLAILIIGFFLITTYPSIFEIMLGFQIEIRILVAMCLIFPLGFFLGMPFPLGILAISRGPRGAIAWAWGMNGLFTIIGGLASVILSVYIGHFFTLIVALFIYSIAFLMFYSMRKVFVEEKTDAAETVKPLLVTPQAT